MTAPWPSLAVRPNGAAVRVWVVQAPTAQAALEVFLHSLPGLKGMRR